jgi:hypothetical protein
MRHDPQLHTKWLLMFCAAVGLSFMLVVAGSGCAIEEPRPSRAHEVEVSGGELPEYEVAPGNADIEARGETDIDVESEHEDDRWYEEDDDEFYLR